MSIVLLLLFLHQKIQQYLSEYPQKGVGANICHSALLPCHCSQLVPDATQTVYYGVQCLSTQLHCNCGLTWAATNARSVLELRQTHTQITENIISQKYGLPNITSIKMKF